MSSKRRICNSAACDVAAERLGGYERIDSSLDAIWDALCRNPYAFPICESDWFSSRFIVTQPTGKAPALVWLIVIDSNGDVVIDYVEEFENY